jgi:HEAT repeat protein
MRLQSIGAMIGRGRLLAAVLVATTPEHAAAASIELEVGLSKLQHYDSDVRIEGIDVLRLLDPNAVGQDEIDQAVKAIAARLQDANPTVRVIAAQALGAMGEAAASVATLLAQAVFDQSRALRHERSGHLALRKVAVAAAAALSRIGPAARDAVPILAQALSHEDAQVRAAAAETLSFMDDGAVVAIPQLLNALRDEDPLVRFQAAYALGATGATEDRVVNALRRALRDQGHASYRTPAQATVFATVRDAAAQALHMLGPQYDYIVTAAGGVVPGEADADQDLPELPWRKGERLSLSIEYADVRDFLGVLLSAHGMQAHIRADVAGTTHIDVDDMPVAGAFNMMLFDFDLTYLWDPRRQDVIVMPLGTAYFPPREGLVTAAVDAKPGNVTDTALTSKPLTNPPVPRPRPTAAMLPTTLPTKVASAPTLETATSQPTGANTDAQGERSEAPQSITTPPRTAVPRTVSASKSTTALPEKPSPPVPPDDEPSEPVGQDSEEQASPLSLQNVAETVDLSSEYRLRYTMQLNGTYVAKIDDTEYRAGSVFRDKRGDMVVSHIERRAVFLLMRTDDGVAEFVIRRKRRR